MIVEQFTYAQGGRAIQKTVYDNGGVTFQDVGAAPDGTQDGVVLSVQVDQQQLFAVQTGVGSSGGGLFGTGFGAGAPIVNQGFNLFGDNNPVNLAPLLHSPAAIVVGLALAATLFAGRGRSGSPRGVQYY